MLRSCTANSLGGAVSRDGALLASNDGENEAPGLGLGASLVGSLRLGEYVGRGETELDGKYECEGTKECNMLGSKEAVG